eukprot:TRINITY_DN932_c0_g3_i1.p1 TRINITY_DN932_c0_g3~~TRINITY_DN932_c0_g3_i1.p1  ORF type:complete len:586 (-),score=197.04 TRINITY_DN932_c0_g3_i1:14-1750(-)
MEKKLGVGLFKRSRKDSKPEKVEKDEEEVVSIGAPSGFEHRVHVNQELKWSNIEEFCLEEKLGEGSFGVVWRAIHRTSKVEIAVKEIAIQSAEERKILKREMDILSKCRHPNIVTYYGFLETSNIMTILMDYCDVGSIADVMEINGGRLSEDFIACITHEVLLGLSYLHRINIIHRDIKSHNILVSLKPRAQIKIADFGISVVTDLQMKAQTITGSPYWMSPEILAGTYNHMTDIWSMGITCIEMAEGHPPHWSLPPTAVMLMIPTSPPPSLYAKREFSPEFQGFVTRMLKKLPTDRPTTDQLLTDPFVKSSTGLEAFLQHTFNLKIQERSRTGSSNESGSQIPSIRSSSGTSSSGSFGTRNFQVEEDTGSVIINNTPSDTVIINNSGRNFQLEEDTGTVIINKTPENSGKFPESFQAVSIHQEIKNKKVPADRSVDPSPPSPSPMASPSPPPSSPSIPTSDPSDVKVHRSVSVGWIVVAFLVLLVSVLFMNFQLENGTTSHLNTIAPLHAPSLIPDPAIPSPRHRSSDVDRQKPSSEYAWGEDAGNDVSRIKSQLRLKVRSAYLTFWDLLSSDSDEE